MYLAAAGPGLGNVLLKLRQREGLGDTHRSGLVADQRLGAHPDDVVDVDVIAEDDLLPGLEVDNGCQIRVRKTEIVVESTVLTVPVGISGIVDSRLTSAQE